MIKYLYSGQKPALLKARVPAGLVVELLLLADEYMLDHLKQLCEKRLAKEISDESVFELHDLAESTNAWQLANACKHHIRNSSTLALGSLGSGSTNFNQTNQIKNQNQSRGYY